MVIREMTLAELEGSDAGVQAAEEASHMDEQAFRVFYEKTARPLASYLYRLSGNATLAEDLVQESYYRFLRADLKSSDEAHQKNYLFRIATNLMRDHWRRRPGGIQRDGRPTETIEAGDRSAEQAERRSDLGRALARLKPREREMLWLAYVEGFSHKEIAEVVGLRTASIRLLLFRARRKLVGFLHRAA